MIDLYFNSTPNGWKVTIMLEEIGLPYRIIPISFDEGDQYSEAFRRINPNGRIPAIVDPACEGGPITIFESGAILVYLAEKTGKLLPADEHGRFAVLQWVMWQMAGLGPIAGQNGHFLFYAPEEVPYAIHRFGKEVRRLYGVMNARLAETGEYLAGAYSIADIACFPWIMTHKRQGLMLDDYPHLRRWFKDLRGREALQRGLAVGGPIERPAKTLDPEAKARFFGYERLERNAD